MGNYISVIQLNLLIEAKENGDTALEYINLKKLVASIYPQLKNEIFADKLKIDIFYVESHQITIQMLGQFSPKDESDLILKYTNHNDFLNNEIKNILEFYFHGIIFKSELGQMNFNSIK